MVYCFSIVAWLPFAQACYVSSVLDGLFTMLASPRHSFLFFHYKDVAVGYKMVGNAVPVALGKALADKIMADLSS
jgi:hypothetical protein